MYNSKQLADTEKNGKISRTFQVNTNIWVDTNIISHKAETFSHRTLQNTSLHSEANLPSTLQTVLYRVLHVFML